MSKLVPELYKQRASLREDMSTLIQDSVRPLQASVDALRKTVKTFHGRLTSAESRAGENFDRLNVAEATIKKLQAENATLLDRVDDLENRSRRANLRIVNVPEGSESFWDALAGLTICHPYSRMKDMGSLCFLCSAEAVVGVL